MKVSFCKAICFHSVSVFARLIDGLFIRYLVVQKGHRASRGRNRRSDVYLTWKWYAVCTSVSLIPYVDLKPCLFAICLAICEKFKGKPELELTRMEGLWNI